MKRFTLSFTLLVLFVASAATARAGSSDPFDSWPHAVPKRGYTHFAMTWVNGSAVRKACGPPIGPEHRGRHGGYWQAFHHCRMAEAAVRVAVTPTPAPRPATPIPDTPGTYELGLMNATRAQYGLPPYVEDGAMSGGSSGCIGALGHSRHMAQTDTLAHDQFPADVCGAYSSAGENVGYASGDLNSALSAIHTSMMSEPHSEGCSGNHACSIISSQYTRVGIGIVQAGGVTWLTVDFAG